MVLYFILFFGLLLLRLVFGLARLGLASSLVYVYLVRNDYLARLYL